MNTQRNWMRGLAIAVLGLAVTTVVMVGFVIAALVKVNSTIDSLDEARDRTTCVTETTAPFWSHVARGLVELRRDGVISAQTADRLDADADRLDTIEQRCP